MNLYEVFSLPWIQIGLGLLAVYAVLVILLALFPRGWRRLNRSTKRATKTPPKENAESEQEAINKMP